MEKSATGPKSPARMRRVKRLKRLIVATVLTLIFLPLAISIYLGCLVHGLNGELTAAKEELNYYMELVSESAFEIEETVIEEEPKPVIQTKKEEKPNVGSLEGLSLSDEELYDGYRKVYLTFDDGPSSNTDAILDVLSEYDVKATFFVVRRDGLNNEKRYQRIVNEGHSIGMHSTSHVYKDLYKDVESFKADTKELRDFIYMVTGVESDIYRFPGGSSNKVSRTDMHLFADELSKEGIVFFDWNISSQDASAILQTKGQIVRNATEKITKYDEVIILFHDLGSKVSTVEALPEIIEYIQGLDNTVILPITRETNPIHHLSVDKGN